MNNNTITRYEQSAKGYIEPDTKIFEITDSKINLSDSYYPLLDWQLKMLDDIVNIACFNQNLAVYCNTSLFTPVYKNGFHYNILILTSHQVYLINLDTNKCHEIKYYFKHK